MTHSILGRDMGWQAVATAALCAMLSGCYTITDNPKNPLPPGSPGLMSYEPPLPPDYRQQIVAKVREAAKDPYSIRDAAISRPMRRFVGLLNGGEATVVCVRMNAKNSFGAYTGVKSVTVIFDQAGQIVNVVGEATTACSGPAVYYEAFPELDQVGEVVTPAQPTRLAPPAPPLASAAGAAVAAPAAAVCEPVREARYGQGCDCPYDRKSNGYRCGGTSAYSRPGGGSPVCYTCDEQ